MRWLILTLLTSFYSACGYDQPPNQAAREAVDSLRKVQAATQVGMTYEQYNGLVIEAKHKTNSAARESIAEPLKTELNSAIDCYTDGVTVWQQKLVGASLLYTLYEPGKSLLPKYSIKPSKVGLSGRAADTDEVLKIILVECDSHVSKASYLLDHSTPTP